LRLRTAVSEGLSLKAVEVIGLLLAGGLFAWWQLRDVNRAMKKSQAEKARRAAEEAEQETGKPP
jgi:uncharacterized protein HemX